jgi:hypothetical protein
VYFKVLYLTTSPALEQAFPVTGFAAKAMFSEIGAKKTHSAINKALWRMDRE